MKKVTKVVVALGFVAAAVAFGPKVKIEITEGSAAACPTGVVDC